MMVRVRYTLIRYVFIQRTITVLVISDLSHVTLPIDVWMSWIEKKFFKIKQKQINDHQVSIVSHLSRTKIYRFVSLGLTHCLDLDLNGLLTRRNFWRIPGMLGHYTIPKWKEFSKSREQILRISYLSIFINMDSARGTSLKKS